MRTHVFEKFDDNFLSYVVANLNIHEDIFSVFSNSNFLLPLLCKPLINDYPLSVNIPKVLKSPFHEF